MKNMKGFGAVGAVLIVVIAIFIGIAGQYAWEQYKQSQVDSFESCRAAGNPIMESYSEQCSANGKTFTNTELETIEPGNPESSGSGDISSFQDCIAAGNPVTQSYPEQCRANGKIYTNLLQLRDQ